MKHIQLIVKSILHLQARVGPMITPYVAELAVYEPRAPIVFFGAIALLARQDLEMVQNTYLKRYVGFYSFLAICLQFSGDLSTRDSQSEASS